MKNVNPKVFFESALHFSNILIEIAELDSLEVWTAELEVLRDN